MSFLDKINGILSERRQSTEQAYHVALRDAVRGRGNAETIADMASKLGIEADQIEAHLGATCRLASADQTPIDMAALLCAMHSQRAAVRKLDADEVAEIERVRAHFAGQRAPLVAIGSAMHGLHSALGRIGEQREAGERALAGLPNRLAAPEDASATAELDRAERFIAEAGDADGMARVVLGWRAVGAVVTAHAAGLSGDQLQRAERLGREALAIVGEFDMSAYCPTEPGNAPTETVSAADYGFVNA